MKGSVKPHPFIGLLIIDVMNRFIFGHGVVIYYLSHNDALLYKMPRNLPKVNQIIYTLDIICMPNIMILPQAVL